VRHEIFIAELVKTVTLACCNVLNGT